MELKIQMRMIALMVCLVSIAATAMEQTVQELPFLTTDIYVNIIDQLMPERRFGNSEEIKSFGKISLLFPMCLLGKISDEDMTINQINSHNRSLLICNV